MSACENWIIIISVCVTWKSMDTALVCVRKFLYSVSDAQNGNIFCWKTSIFCFSNQINYWYDDKPKNMFKFVMKFTWNWSFYFLNFSFSLVLMITIHKLLNFNILKTNSREKKRKHLKKRNNRFQVHNIKNSNLFLEIVLH